MVIDVSMISIAPQEGAEGHLLYVNHLVEQDCAFNVPHKSLAIMKRLLSLAMVLSFRPL